MSFVFKMPDVGEGINEGEIVKWNVKVGDEIKVDETLVEIQNDKLVQDVPSPVTGKITKIHVEEGSVAIVGEPLVEFAVDGDVPVEAQEEVVVKEEVKASTGNNIYTVTLPNVGEGVMEGEIVSWMKKVGETVSQDEGLLEVQNDKLVQDVPSPVSGVVSKIIVEAGTVATVGDAIAEITVEGDVAVPQAEVKAVEAKVDAPQAKVVAGNGSSIVADRVLAMPSVRQYARDLGIDITTVSGTGNRGHITKADLDNYGTAPVAEAAVETVAQTTQAAPVQAAQAVAVQSVGGEVREAMTPTRRAIASAMVNSKAQAPHVTLFEEVDVTELMAHRSRFKEVALKQDIKLTYLAYMTKAVAVVLRKYPILNAKVDSANNEIVYNNVFNVGIAVDTDHGLYVPNVKDADRKGILTIAKEISELAGLAHEGTLTRDQMTNGSSTISNIGSAWGMWFTPIINFPEVAIFGMGRIEKKPVVKSDNTIGIGNILHLSMSFDHRIIDGALAQNAMNELKTLLSDPELLLMEG